MQQIHLFTDKTEKNETFFQPATLTSLQKALRAFKGFQKNSDRQDQGHWPRIYKIWQFYINLLQHFASIAPLSVFQLFYIWLLPFPGFPIFTSASDSFRLVPLP